MTLNNLVGINLEKIPIDHSTIKRLIIAAKRNIDDSKIGAISAENRFDNVTDYLGDIVPESIVKDCIFQAEKLLKHFKNSNKEICK